MKCFFGIVFCLSMWSFTVSSKELTGNLLSENRTDTVIRYAPKLLTNRLPKLVEEQSGMAWHQGLFWVINDSDCQPEIIAYNKQGGIQKRVEVENARNIDWEDLAEDENYLYIGDFGNNHGNRKDLRVLKVSKKAMNQGGSVRAEEIRFAWADQQDFSRRTHRNNYDCEAFFAWGDSLYLFTKNWADLRTRLYVLPKTPGEFKPQVRDEFEIDFLVTAADISSDGKTIALLGYKDYLSYMTIFSNYKGTEFFKGNSIRVDLSSLGACQTEGVVFGDNNQLFISCEKSMTPQALYQVEWEQWFSFSGH
ncbi:MAG: hypothetical protein ACEPOZ_17995 [Marinifilaceae bacterium]